MLCASILFINFTHHNNEHMRNLLAALSLMIISQFTFAQESNESLLKRAQTELDIAVEKEDYEKAAALKKEIEIRKQIEEAVANEDFEEASRLKKQLTSSDSQIEETNENDSPEISDYQFPEPTEGKAIIEFVKVTAQGWNTEVMLFDNDKYVGSCWGVSHMRLEVDPGEHLLWIEAVDQLGFVEANLEANEIYIVIIDMNGTGSFMKIGLSPMSMDNVSLVDRAKRVIYKHPVKVTSEEDIQKKRIKLDKKEFIQKRLTKYEKKYKSSPKTKVLSGDMSIPLDYMHR